MAIIVICVAYRKKGVYLFIYYYNIFSFSPSFKWFVNLLKFQKQLAGEYSVIVLAMNYCINFFIHLVTSSQFRKDLTEVFCCSNNSNQNATASTNDTNTV